MVLVRNVKMSATTGEKFNKTDLQISYRLLLALQDFFCLRYLNDKSAPIENSHLLYHKDFVGIVGWFDADK